MLRYFLGFIVLIQAHFLQAQVVSVLPIHPTAEDSVSITFYADRGNQALKDTEDAVYVHTGVIIGTAEEPSGWRYVQGNWGQDDARVKMKKIAPNMFEIKYHIRSFYGFSEEEPFLQLAFVFRNADGTRVAKEENEKDIFYPTMKTYPNGILETVSGADGQDIGNFVSLDVKENEIEITGTRSMISLTYYTDELIEIAHKKNRKQPEEFTAGVVIAPTKWEKKIQNKQGQPIQITWGAGYKVEIQKSPIRLSFYRADTLLFKDEIGMFMDTTEKICGSRIQLSPQEHIYGTGSRAVNIDRRGQRVYTYNTASFGYTLGETKLNLSIPYIQSSRMYGLFFDNPRSGYFDIGKTEANVLEFAVKDTALRYFLVLGNSHAKMTENYTHLTGRQDMPPLWTLGFIQSRYGYKSQAETEEIVEKTLAAGYPLEAILLDLYWFGDLAQMGNLNFNFDMFPKPSQMIQNLNQKGVKTILITESYFVKTSNFYKELDSLGYFAKTLSGTTARIPDFWAGPAALLDVFHPKSQEWFSHKYDFLMRTYHHHGWWCDSGEPENHPKRMIHTIGKAEDIHNLYPLFWAKMIAENHRKNFPSQRLFNLARSGYAGVQRYNIFPWSGDVSRSWDALRAQPSIMLGAGTCGIGYMHSDLGGFTGGPLDESLYYRWLQMGAFVPVMRAHGSGLPSEPIFFSDTTQQYVKEAISLRYRLLPYNYQLCWENHTKGLPLARPLYFHFPQDARASQIDDEYLWGENLLIAPIFEKGNMSRKVYLPKGKWFDYHSFHSYWGENTVNIPVFQDKIPVFVKAGSFIPSLPDISHTSQYKTDTLIINYFPDQSAPTTAYTLYNDNGETPNPDKLKTYSLIQFSGSNHADNLTIAVKNEGSYPSMPARRFLIWGINNIQSLPTKVMIEEKELAIVTGSPQSRQDACYWNPQTKQLIFYLKWGNQPINIQIKGKSILE